MPLCASLDGFTLHAATRAGAHHAAAREALLRYVLIPPIAQERVELQQDGLVRLSLKRAFAEWTVAVDMDPLSLLCRLATSVPPPRFQSASTWWRLGASGHASTTSSLRSWRSASSGSWIPVSIAGTWPRRSCRGRSTRPDAPMLLRRRVGASSTECRRGWTTAARCHRLLSSAY
ncbi:transposase [Sorangium sp. So ce726]|uniref:transposase n=1 Tax=Sorangium sp. So ce726 TaxID=3133319 RepID=UPI003F62BAC1